MVTVTPTWGLSAFLLCGWLCGWLLLYLFLHSPAQQGGRHVSTLSVPDDRTQAPNFPSVITVACDFSTIACDFSTISHCL